MKKILVLLMILCLFMVGCKKEAKPNDTSSNNPNSSVNSTVDDDNTSQEETPSEDTSDVSSEDTSTEEPVIPTVSEEEEPKITGMVLEAEENSGEDTPNKSDLDLIGTEKGGYDKEAAKKRESILNASDNLKVKGKTFYISPKGDDWNDGLTPETAWASLDGLSINSYNISSGDAVLFERGSIFRQTSTISVKSGVTYGAYGKGAKPCIYGSAYNYAKPGVWQPSNKKNVWKMDLPLKDAGIVVYNHGEICGNHRRGILSLEENGDFYHDTTGAVIYIYCDKGSPDKVWDDIEIGVDQPIFTLTGYTKDVVIDNLCLKYTGSFAVMAHTNHTNVKITNCEIGWIGGSFQEESIVVRYGNGIQFYGDNDHITVKDNWIYQVYDAGVTFQNARNGGTFSDIAFDDNLIEYCTYAIEFFGGSGDGTATMSNISFKNNIMRFSGFGFGNQRSDSTEVAHIRGGLRYYPNNKNFVIKNNIFDTTTHQFVSWFNKTASQPGMLISGNSFYQKKYTKNNPIMNYDNIGVLFASNQKTLEEAVNVFDKSPKLIKWAEK